MKVILEGTPTEIAALAVAVQEQQTEDVMREIADKLTEQISSSHIL